MVPFDQAPDFTYSRADAIRDGELADVTPMAREAGIRCPVAVTRGAWERCVTGPPGAPHQDEAERGVFLLQVLHTFAFLFESRGKDRCGGRFDHHMCDGSQYSAHVIAKEGGLQIEIYVREGPRPWSPVQAWLKARCGPDGQDGAAITVMLSDED